MTQLIFVRHGQTNSNVERRWQGWTDTPLNDLGHAQAQLAAKRLGGFSGHIHALYSSPLSRAYQTSKPIAESLNLPIRLVEGLKEFNFGEIEGLTKDEVQIKHPGLLERWQDHSDLSLAYPGGESRLGFMKRIADTLALISVRHPEETVVVVSHGGVLRAALFHYFPERAEEWGTLGASNCSLTYIQINGCNSELITLNEREHLQELDMAIPWPM